MKIVDKSEIIADSMISLMNKADGTKLQTEVAFKRARIQMRAAAVANTALANIGRFSKGATDTLVTAHKVANVPLDVTKVVGIINNM
jgi:hypothetical protein